MNVGGGEKCLQPDARSATQDGFISRAAQEESGPLLEERSGHRQQRMGGGRVVDGDSVSGNGLMRLPGLGLQRLTVFLDLDVDSRRSILCYSHVSRMPHAKADALT